MGVFKWLRRERLTVTEEVITTPTTTSAPKIIVKAQGSQSAAHIGTIRTEEYKRDLAEFQARRSHGNKDPPETPVKKKCGRHSLPVSCTACSTDMDNTFNYEKKSATKYKKRSHRRTRSAAVDTEGLPSIQFLFQNQVFMPGNLLPTSNYTEPRKTRRTSPFVTDFFKQSDVTEENTKSLLYKNNSLPIDMKTFREGINIKEEIDGVTLMEKASSQGSFDAKMDSSVWEVMNELKSFDLWADEQLQTQSGSKSDDSKSDTSAYGLPVASAINMDITKSSDHHKWDHGSWGQVPVQVKKLVGVTVGHVKQKVNTEINILRKYRHPNIILLMALFPDIHQNVYIVCERCVDSLFGILHVQGRILCAQTSIHYVTDVANALAFLRMQGFVHTELTSHSIMITSHDAAKLTDLGPCMKLSKVKPNVKKGYEMYSPEPQYVNIEDTRESTTAESEPLLSQHSSETYLISNAVVKPYKQYQDSEYYRWHAPELFEPDEEGMVRPCPKSDVYSLCLILWECCNAAIPWKTLTYAKLKELYLLWNTGIRLPQDGTYPGSLLALLQSGLKLARSERINIDELQSSLLKVKRNLDDLEYIVIPARLPKKLSNFSSAAWDTNSPTDESECLSPLSKNSEHKVVVHKSDESSDTSEKESKSDGSPLYETLRNDKHCAKLSMPEKCYISDDDNIEVKPILKYDHIPEKDYSSACSTPLAKVRARIKDIGGTPGALHKSDSTEYCSFLSPDNNFIFNDGTIDSVERPNAKLSRSFTPKSYKPLHIKVPECNLDSVKSILKDYNGTERSLYNFDIKNYSLPTTPIARSNKLRRNAWLSGELSLGKSLGKVPEIKTVQSAPDTPRNNCSPVAVAEAGNEHHSYRVEEYSPESLDTGGNSVTGLRRVEPPSEFSPETDYYTREGTNSWSKSSIERAPSKHKEMEDVLANVNVKPLVAIHERWIYEANRKTGRSMSLPESNSCRIPAVKPASHCVDTLLKSFPHLNAKKAASKPFRGHPVSPASSGKSGSHWEQFCQARESVAKCINFGNRDIDRFRTWKKDADKGTLTEEDTYVEQRTDQATDTRSIEDFIRDLIRKELQHMLHEISDDNSSSFAKNDEIINKGVANVVENLRNGEDANQTLKKDANLKSFSRVKINGNNKPLLQITFSRSGENSLQVLDNCVNVTICDNNNSGKDNLNISMEDTVSSDDVQAPSLKRCQAFNAIQEARSTEDLYIDDDLSTQMQENFGGRVKLIPLHGSLHEILCEKEDDCCLIKVKQENGCDTIYFRCDNSDTESRDAIDGCSFDNSRAQDTVLFKRSISLVEERIQRVFPKDKKNKTPLVCRRTKSNECNKAQSKSEVNQFVQTPIVCRRTKNTECENIRPKSEVFVQTINEGTRVLSNSSPSLVTTGDEIELNIENVMSYQDSSSEECVKNLQETDDFELLEKKIEADLAKADIAGVINTNAELAEVDLNKSSLNCGYLQKISEENLSVLNEDIDSEAEKENTEIV